MRLRNHIKPTIHSAGQAKIQFCFPFLSIHTKIHGFHEPTQPSKKNADNERFQLRINENYHCDLSARCLAAAAAVSAIVTVVVVDYVVLAGHTLKCCHHAFFDSMQFGIALYDTSEDNFLSSKFIIKNR